MHVIYLGLGLAPHRWLPQPSRDCRPGHAVSVMTLDDVVAPTGPARSKKVMPPPSRSVRGRS